MITAIPPLKPIPKKNRGRPLRSVIPKDTPFVDRTGPGGKALIKKREPQLTVKALNKVVALPPAHPDCKRCEASRQRAADRMRKKRGEVM